jgi:hypothetical protein
MPEPIPARRSWPLVTLASLSFIPGLGFLLAAIAVSWALVSDRPKARLALILGGAGALLNVVGALLTFYLFRDTTLMREARRASAQQNLVQILLALEQDRGTKGRYPATLEELVGRPVPTKLINITDQSATLLAMYPFHYRLSADGESYDLFAVGPDGKPGTEDDIRPVIPDSLLDETGFVAGE